jgi:hypothetical protein
MGLGKRDGENSASTRWRRPGQHRNGGIRPRMWDRSELCRSKRSCSIISVPGSAVTERASGVSSGFLCIRISGPQKSHSAGCRFRGRADIAWTTADVRKWRIVLKKSKIERLRKSREVLLAEASFDVDPRSRSAASPRGRSALRLQPHESSPHWKASDADANPKSMASSDL